ncbi:MAG: hypothetical protein HOM68_24725 [Gemmatimonadetes bacterium]|jgi:hypothetical protein|nr:hypothetical protein [Gemmatimonadota bacterium]MBT4609616.1 hypothetical protein [Gemmatimonadota bacterium]MBT5059775.1 hypothetical protein [Gemmatimonadota bacterium]MBT5143029.1 hypothetical protein [Gemmatimonadota bacterium]MBT5588295.1 hypothetical protein [Gemmatimonadota bacterium]
MTTPESEVATRPEPEVNRKPLIPLWVKAAFLAAPVMGIVSAAAGSFLVGGVAALGVMATAWAALEYLSRRRRSRLT